MKGIPAYNEASELGSGRRERPAAVAWLQAEESKRPAVQNAFRSEFELHAALIVSAEAERWDLCVQLHRVGASVKELSERLALHMATGIASSLVEGSAPGNPPHGHDHRLIAQAASHALERRDGMAPERLPEVIVGACCEFPSAYERLLQAVWSNGDIERSAQMLRAGVPHETHTLNVFIDTANPDAFERWVALRPSAKALSGCLRHEEYLISVSGRNVALALSGGGDLRADLHAGTEKIVMRHWPEDASEPLAGLSMEKLGPLGQLARRADRDDLADYIEAGLAREQASSRPRRLQRMR